MVRIVTVHLQVERAVVLSEAVSGSTLQVNLRSTDELPRGTLVVSDVSLDLVFEVLELTILNTSFAY